jgi:hypothetical protein
MRRRPSHFAFAFVAFGSLLAIGACGSRTLDQGSTTGDASTDGAVDAADFSKCDGTTQCILATPGCCAACGPVTLASFVAIDATQAGAFRSATCTAPMPCPNCASIPDPNFVAACRSGSCTAIDLRTDAISACTTDADCRLRWGGDCCECGAPLYDLISIASANEAQLDAILCAPATTCTRHCAPSPYPTDKKPVCNPTTLHCEVSP